MPKKLLFLFISSFFTSFLNAQETPFEKLKDVVVQIGMINNGRFQTVGSGLSTYVMVNSTMVTCIITAGHIIDAFVKNNRDSFYVRYSWADSIKTTQYFGTGIPMRIFNKMPSHFRSSSPSIDLGCIVVPRYDTIAENYYNVTNHGKGHVYPINSINDPILGQTTAMFGYPQNIENVFNPLDYSVCTIKPGLISWISHVKIDPRIDPYVLVETNSTFGNSGGPVFTVPDLIVNTSSQLVGIASSIYTESTALPLMSDTNIVKDQKTNKPYYINATSKTGMAVLVRSNVIRIFLQDVQSFMQKNSKAYLIP